MARKPVQVGDVYDVSVPHLNAKTLTVVAVQNYKTVGGREQIAYRVKPESSSVMFPVDINYLEMYGRRRK
jgi:hypothetical protein